MGLEDRDALQVLRSVLDPPDADNELVHRFYTRWFAIDPAVRDLFPPDMGRQRAAFGQAVRWVLGELIAQRSEEPVAFLAQLGRDHRKYGVTQQHYQAMQEALYSSFRSRLAEEWNAALDEAAREALALIIGVMSGAAEGESGPAWWDGTVVDHQRVSRDLAVVRLQLDRPMDYPRASSSRSRFRSARAAGATSARRSLPIRPARSSSTFALCPAGWSAPRSSARPIPGSAGDCPRRTARWRSTARAATC